MITAADVGCRDCGLCEGRSNVVPGSGNLHARLMVVAEAPGREEDASGTPMVGQSGRLARSTLAEAGATSDDIYITNVVKCRPPDNRNPRPEELEACMPWLLMEIQEIQPTVILSMGRFARDQVTRALSSLGSDIQHFNVYHPAYILRNRKKQAAWTIEVQRVVDIVKGRAQQQEGTLAGLGWPLVIDDVEVLGRLLSSAPYLALDTETDPTGPGEPDRLVSWSLSDGETGLFVEHTPERLCWLQQVWEYARNRPLVLHNLKYDLPVCEAAGVIVPPDARLEDTMLIAYVAREERIGLKDLSLGIGMTLHHIQDILGRGKKKRVFSEALADPKTRERAQHYGAEDAVATARLYPALLEKLDPVQQRYYYGIELPLIPSLLAMERRGVLLDDDQLTELDAFLAREIEVAEVEVVRFLGEDCSPSSRDEVAARLIKIGLPLTETTETGKISTEKKALLKALGVAREADIPASQFGGVVGALLQWRKLQKLRATYVDALRRKRDGQGRIHGRFNQAGSEAFEDTNAIEGPGTNRLSSADPNLQNIPKKGLLGKRIRYAFIPSPGMTWVRCDQSQLELRIIADITGEPALVDAFREGRDVHQAAALELSISRDDAKNVMYAIAFGVEVDRAATTAGKSREEAGLFVAKMRATFPGLTSLKQRAEKQLSAQGYVETLLGWRQYYPDYWSPVRKLVAAALREAANLPIQGTAAGIMKVLQVEAHKLVQEFGGYMLLQVHDELDFEVPTEVAPEFMQRLNLLSEEIAQRYLKVPLVLDVSEDTSWGACS